MEFFSVPARNNAARSYDHIRVRPVTGALGAEVLDVDLPRLDAASFAEVQQAGRDHQVLVFRAQSLEIEDLERFTQRWGAFGDDPFVQNMAGHPNVVEVVKEADERHPLVFGGAWHSDWSFQASPPSWTLLYGVDIPDYGGDTLFANTHLGYECLSETMKGMLEPLTAIHSPQRAYGAQARHNELFENMKILYGEAAHIEREHPLVRSHPETGRRALFVNPGYTARIEGMRASESDMLLRYLFDVTTNPAFLCRVRWEPGTLVMWDNRCALHNPVPDYHGLRRAMWRTTVHGSTPELKPSLAA